MMSFPKEVILIVIIVKYLYGTSIHGSKAPNNCIVIKSAKTHTIHNMCPNIIAD